MESLPLSQNLWERYGFTDNPYDTKALSISKGTSLSVEEAYIERDLPSEATLLLTNFLRNPGGGRIVIEGDPGVGKTTFVNFHRQRWATASKQKLLSPVTEISVREGWTERDFLLNLLASLSSRIRLDLSARDFERNKTLREVAAISGVRVEEGGGFTGTLTILGIGGGLGHSKSASVKVGEVTNDQLKEYLRRLCEMVRDRGFAGVIFHLDNLDMHARKGPESLRNFFESVRDVLQEPHLYFIFVGYKGLFQQVIVPQPRVRSIFFDTPVYLEPLSPQQVLQAIQKRYHLLTTPGQRSIKPVEDEVILGLYEIFQGRIRYVMNAITSLVSHLPDSYAQSLDLRESITILGRILRSEVDHVLTPSSIEVFLHAVRKLRFTNSDLCLLTGKSKQLIQKHLSHWLDKGFIFHSDKQGRNQFYEIEPRFAILAQAIGQLSSKK